MEPSEGSARMKKIILSAIAIATIAATLSVAPPVYAADVLWQRYTDQGREAKKEGSLADAEKYFRAALERALELHATGAVLRESYQNLADTKYLHGHYEDAVPLFKHAIESYGEELKRMPSSTNDQNRRDLCEQMVKEQMSLADCYRAEGKYKLGEALYRAAFKTLDDSHDDNKLARAHIQSELGDCLSVEARYAEAEAMYKEALPVLEKYNATDILVDLLQDYDALMRATNRGAEAEKLEAKLAAIRAQEAQAVTRANK
jgi:tetratricopeptide (TPR) repeat protein